MAENKVTYGLKNAHYAVITEDVNGLVTYGTPVKLPGSTALTMEARGEKTDFYADNTLYFSETVNDGYDATLTLARITEAFRKDVLGETLVATDNALTEVATAKPKKIALLFEFEGDQKSTRHCLYYCFVSRPGLSSNTKTNTVEANTTELSLIASARPEDSVVKRSTTATTTETVYNAWYTAVYDPA